ncbi:DnaJ molecular chaperone homology domain [Teratosphaeria destructans]|uniref:DnaJ molecular chaperone homology domain n=1 Tax=Teratosphaeria destructans TaxID=418781 RepID=A0A9W7SN82_9PEZI|nr:DnaJ molecular chaperone homology domain [Teratosphaeria destructans]
MVKASVNHNYYADLEVPTTATVDEIKKQYRKLALLYHPDRNAGKEEEFIPKFQAIQTAHEILSDPTTKAKYDADRRKAGLYPSSAFGGAAAPRQPTGNPYAATSAYPPPPRRTQPGTWQRPQPSAAAGTAPSGAERFTNFPRAAPTARKDPAQDRTNMFKAWQNMNNAADRQQRFTPAAPPPGATASSNRPRPPPRSDTKIPSEEEIRAGMSYRKAPPPPPPRPDPEAAGAHSSAWASFQQQQKKPSRPGTSRNNTSKTPRKHGFDPNAPGSDERPAAAGGYAQRHRSEDYGQPPMQQEYPPPPPGPPPQSPLTPGVSPTAQQRPQGGQHRSSKSRGYDEGQPQVPYAEGNRVRTPYTSISGEKTQFTRDSNDGLRRSASTRDSTKLDPSSARSSRARSTSPTGRTPPADDHKHQNGAAPGTFGGVDYSDSDASPSPTRPMSTSTDDSRGTGSRPGTASQPSPFAPPRPMKVPTPRSKRYNGSIDSSVPGARSDTEGYPGMQQKNAHNMYVNVNPLHHDTFNASPFVTAEWPASAFGPTSASVSESRKREWANVPEWAIPPSVRYGQPEGKGQNVSSDDRTERASPAFEDDSTPRQHYKVDALYAAASPELQDACDFFYDVLTRHYGSVPSAYDMEIFLKLASTASVGRSSGNQLIDDAMSRILSLYPCVACTVFEIMMENSANKRTRLNSFTYRFNNDAFTPGGKSRSEENINTNFSPDGFNGSFVGQPDYFAPPPSTAKKSSSPPGRQKGGPASTTSPYVSANGNATFGPASADSANGSNVSSSSKFDPQEWDGAFTDPSWVSGNPPPKPSSPIKGNKARSRKSSRAANASETTGSMEQPHVVDDDAGPSGGASVGQGDGTSATDYADEMDIDSAPPASDVHANAQAVPKQAAASKEPRLVSVPPSAWRQSQGPPGTKSDDPALKANLEDLARVEPFAAHAGGEGLQSFAGLSSTLPFQSQASAPEQPQPRTLKLPQRPKAPEPPQRLTKESWHNYVAAFGSYLGAYHAFNTTLIKHFEAREVQAKEYLSGGTAWLEAAGTTANSKGFPSYLQGVMDDEQVREAWSIGHERHQDAVKTFDGIRERVRKLAAAAALADH